MPNCQAKSYREMMIQKFTNKNSRDPHSAGETRSHFRPQPGSVSFLLYQRCPSLDFLLEPEPIFFYFVFLGEPEPELFWFSIFVGARARACFSLSFGWSRSQSFFGFGFLGEPDLELSLAPSFGWSQSKDSAFLGLP